MKQSKKWPVWKAILVVRDCVDVIAYNVLCVGVFFMFLVGSVLLVHTLREQYTEDCTRENVELNADVLSRCVDARFGNFYDGFKIVNYLAFGLLVWYVIKQLIYSVEG